MYVPNHVWGFDFFTSQQRLLGFAYGCKGDEEPKSTGSWKRFGFVLPIIGAIIVFLADPHAITVTCAYFGSDCSHPWSFVMISIFRRIGWLSECLCVCMGWPTVRPSVTNGPRTVHKRSPWLDHLRFVRYTNRKRRVPIWRSFAKCAIFIFRHHGTLHLVSKSNLPHLV